jgi:2-polyprenyl-6-methoxyphenol hydroxylase-like FAD-dependent oxidoreductase
MTWKSRRSSKYSILLSISSILLHGLTKGLCNSFGEYGHVLHRANLLSVLYDSFSDEDKKKILTNKKVTEVLSDENGVEVKCEDGTSYEGSIVIGADGISSAARKAVRELSAKAGLPDLDGEQPFKTTYRMLWFSAPRPTRLKPGRGGLSFGKPASVQLLVGKDKCWIFLYERLEKETRERFFYSEQEMLDLMDKWGHLTCDDGLAIRDVFATRYKAGLINVEEGVVKQWSQGRVVLAGDSIHKFTPSAGLGYNNGVQDITVCLNEVLRLVRADPNPSVQALKGAFERYQTIRTPHLLKDYEASAMATRYQAYETFTLWFVDRFIMRFFTFAQRGLLNLGHPERTKITRPLEFLPGTEPFTGKIPWEFPMSTHAAPIR